MIRIAKPHQAPNILKTKGKAKRRANLAVHRRGSQDFDFDSKVYGHKTVKESLIKAQHDKCFLCESKITHISYGDVEHFRPKAGYCQNAGDSIHKPGYYWLAFEWSNLFLACQLCNQLFKKNLFPLSNPTGRATSHRHSIKKEKSLFIDPTIDDPEQLISFREEIPFPVENNPRGKATIEYLGLRREKLNEKRREVYERLRLLYIIAYKLPPADESTEAKSLLDKAVQDSAEYAGMVRAAIREEFKSIP